MRTLLILSCILITLKVNCQIFSFGDPSIKGNVRFIIEKSNGYKADWREYSFDSLSRIIEIKYFRDNELLGNDFFNYKMENDSFLIVSKTNKSRRGIEMSNSKYFYDSQKRIIRYEYFKENSLTPMIVELNAKYENGRILQFDRMLIPNDTSVIETYSYKYLDNKILIKKSDNKVINSETTTIKLDKNGNWIDKIVDNCNPECVLGGIRTFSPFRHDKYRIKYEFDKNGNWIQSYSITLFWRYKRHKRVIEYY
jgi:hypothetical protein